MTQQAVVFDYLAAATGALAKGDIAGAMGQASAGLLQAPGDPGLQLLFAQAALALRDTASARRALEQLDTAPPSFAVASLRVDLALLAGDVMAARTIFAGAEAAGELAGWQGALLKARVAAATADWMAARAILVMAIERYPDIGALRQYLAEVMVASGGAADTRAVLAHIAQPPVNPPVPGEGDPPQAANPPLTA